MVNEKVINFRVEPYIQEVTLAAIMDILAVSILAGVCVFAKISAMIFVAILVVYGTVVMFLHYRVAILATVDKRKRDCVTEVVSTKRLKDEFSFAGDSTGQSYIRLFYPKKQDVCKYRIEVINDQGEKKKLRSVMSFVRSIQFITFDYKPRIERFQVTYLRRSKILLHVALIEEECKHIRPKERRKIDKTIHSINTSI